MKTLYINIGDHQIEVSHYDGDDSISLRDPKAPEGQQAYSFDASEKNKAKKQLQAMCDYAKSNVEQPGLEFIDNL